MHPVIRPATLHDHAAITGLGQRFIQESIYGRLFPTLALSSVTIDLMIGVCLTHGVIFVAEHTGPPNLKLVGMLGVALIENHPAVGGPCVEEVAWYVEPEHRKGRVGPLLLAAAEAWTTTNRASVLKMVAPHGSDVGRFLERRGYTAVETAYMRRPPFA